MDGIKQMRNRFAFFNHGLRLHSGRLPEGNPGPSPGLPHRTAAYGRYVPAPRKIPGQPALLFPLPTGGTLFPSFPPCALRMRSKPPDGRGPCNILYRRKGHIRHTLPSSQPCPCQSGIIFKCYSTGIVQLYTDPIVKRMLLSAMRRCGDAEMRRCGDAESHMLLIQVNRYGTVRHFAFALEVHISTI